MKIKIVLIFTIFIAILGIAFAIKSTNNQLEVGNIKVGEEEKYLQKTNSEGNVEVVAAPRVSEDKKTWSFEVTLTTHEGSLDDDLVKQAFLESSGKKIYPLEWKGAPPGGHHRAGTLIFPSFSQAPKEVKLILEDVGGISQRSFAW